MSPPAGSARTQFAGSLFKAEVGRRESETDRSKNRWIAKPLAKEVRFQAEQPRKQRLS